MTDIDLVACLPECLDVTKRQPPSKVRRRKDEWVKSKAEKRVMSRTAKRARKERCIVAVLTAIKQKHDTMIKIRKALLELNHDFADAEIQAALRYLKKDRVKLTGKKYSV